MRYLNKYSHHTTEHYDKLEHICPHHSSHTTLKYMYNIIVQNSLIHLGVLFIQESSYIMVKPLEVGNNGIIFWKVWVQPLFKSDTNVHVFTWLHLSYTFLSPEMGEGSWCRYSICLFVIRYQRNITLCNALFFFVIRYLRPRIIL